MVVTVGMWTTQRVEQNQEDLLSSWWWKPQNPFTWFWCQGGFLVVHISAIPGTSGYESEQCGQPRECSRTEKTFYSWWWKSWHPFTPFHCQGGFRVVHISDVPRTSGYEIGQCGQPREWTKMEKTFFFVHGNHNTHLHNSGVKVVSGLSTSLTFLVLVVMRWGCGLQTGGLYYYPQIQSRPLSLQSFPPTLKILVILFCWFRIKWLLSADNIYKGCWKGNTWITEGFSEHSIWSILYIDRGS